MVVQEDGVRRVWMPFIFTNEFAGVGSNPILSQCVQACRRHGFSGCRFVGKIRLNFILDKAKVNAKLLLRHSSWNLSKTAESVLPSGFIFQQDDVLILKCLKFRIAAGTGLYKRETLSIKTHTVQKLHLAGGVFLCHMVESCCCFR